MAPSRLKLEKSWKLFYILDPILFLIFFLELIIPALRDNTEIRGRDRDMTVGGRKRREREKERKREGEKVRK